jgi:hypothetical protein
MTTTMGKLVQKGKKNEETFRGKKKAGAGFNKDVFADEVGIRYWGGNACITREDEKPIRPPLLSKGELPSLTFKTNRN